MAKKISKLPFSTLRASTFEGKGQLTRYMISAWPGWPSIFPILEILREHFFSSKFFPNFLLALLTPLLRHYCSHQTYAFYSFLKVFKKRCKISINTLVKYNITSFSSALKALDSGSSLTVCPKRISVIFSPNFFQFFANFICSGKNRNLLSLGDVPVQQ